MVILWFLLFPPVSFQNNDDIYQFIEPNPDTNNIIEDRKKKQKELKKFNRGTLFAHIRSKKHVVLYALVTKDSPNAFLTIANTKSDILEYASALLKLSNIDNFKTWCISNSFDFKDSKAWKYYLNKIVSNEEKDKYLIKCLHYRFEDLVAIMRMFGGCLPLGCSFNTDTELAFFSDDLKELFEESNKHD